MAEITRQVSETQHPWYSILHSRRRRWVIALWFLILPAGSFWLAAAGELRPEWQSGRITGISALLLEPQVLGAALAIVVLGTVAVVAIMFRPPLIEHYLLRAVLWFAAAAGTIFTVILAVASEGFSIGMTLVTLGVGAVLTGLIRLLYSPSSTNLRQVGIVFATLAFVVLVLPYGLVASLGAGPFVVTIAIVAMLRSTTATQSIEPPKQLALATPASLLLIASWYRALQRAVDTYDSLPLEPPHDCYVATAATYGHTRLVGSVAIHEGCRVNSQLRQIKAGEIVLKFASPRLHRYMRRTYDYAGPRLAARSTSPWSADIGFLILLPCQTLANALTRCLGETGRGLEERVYRRLPDS